VKVHPIRLPWLGSLDIHWTGPPHPEDIRMLLYSLLDEGVPSDYLEKMTKANPAFLTGVSS
jgi:hypothetical protein